MAVIRKNLVLNFEAADGSKLELTVLRPLEGLEGTQIKTAMQTIVSAGVFGAASQASKIVGAQYDIRQVDEIALG